MLWWLLNLELGTDGKVICSWPNPQGEKPHLTEIYSAGTVSGFQDKTSFLSRQKCNQLIADILSKYNWDARTERKSKSWSSTWYFTLTLGYFCKYQYVQTRLLSDTVQQDVLFLSNVIQGMGLIFNIQFASDVFKKASDREFYQALVVGGILFNFLWWQWLALILQGHGKEMYHSLFIPL